MVWYFYLLHDFPQFIVIHTVKGFGIVNKAEVYVELSCFLDDPMDVGNLISDFSDFSESSLNIYLDAQGHPAPARSQELSPFPSFLLSGFCSSHPMISERQLPHDETAVLL